MQFLCIHSFSTYKVPQPKIQPTVDHVSTVIFTTEKNPSINGFAQFKPVLFKGQPYVKKMRSLGMVEMWARFFWLFLSRGHFKKLLAGFPGGAVVENLPANAGDTGSSPGLGRSHMPRSN